MKQAAGGGSDDLGVVGVDGAFTQDHRARAERIRATNHRARVARVAYSSAADDKSRTRSKSIGQRSVDHLADCHHTLRGRGIGQRGQSVISGRTDRHARLSGLVGQPSVFLQARPAHQQVLNAAGSAQRFTDGLRALGEKTPG
jgi:hypothetical protein